MKIENIKFKAKRLDNGKWEEGSLLLSERGKVCIGTMLDSNEENGTPVCFKCREVDPSTVCQFTGLKDNEGMDIFEGDLLAEKRFPMYEVGYVNSEFAASYIGENTFIFKLPALSKDCVVCGSIYDRKEGEK